jgi:hypothetical protein
LTGVQLMDQFSRSDGRIEALHRTLTAEIRKFRRGDD